MIDGAALAVLMDIRDELKRLNTTLSAVGCIHGTLQEALREHRALRRDIAKAKRNHRRKI